MQLDGLNPDDNQPVMLLASTNLLNSFDDAMTRRFQVFHLQLPNEQERRSMFQKYIGKGSLMANQTLDQLADLSKGFSGSDIAAAVERSKRQRFRARVECLQGKNKKMRDNVDKLDVVTQIQDIFNVKNKKNR